MGGTTHFFRRRLRVPIAVFFAFERQLYIPSILNLLPKGFSCLLLVDEEISLSLIGEILNKNVHKRNTTSTLMVMAKAI